LPGRLKEKLFRPRTQHRPPHPSLLSSWNEVICGELKHAFSALTSNPKQKEKEKKKNGFAKNTRGIFLVQNMFQSIA